MQAVEILQRYGVVRDVADAHLALADGYMRSERPREALDMIETALQIDSLPPRFLASCYLVGFAAGIGLEDQVQIENYWSMWISLSKEHPFVAEEMEEIFSNLVKGDHVAEGKGRSVTNSQRGA
jgi:hypothetical protein